MALIGNMIATAFAGNPSIVNYDMFVAVFGMLSLFYLIPATFNESFAFHPMLMVGLDVVNALLFVIGGIAMAAYLGVHSCGNSVCFSHSGFEQIIILIQTRTTPTAIKSPTVLAILPSDAVRPKPPLPSYGLALLLLPYLLCSQDCRVDLEVAIEVGLLL
jgi:hypothetical protein